MDPSLEPFASLFLAPENVRVTSEAVLQCVQLQLGSEFVESIRSDVLEGANPLVEQGYASVYWRYARAPLQLDWLQTANREFVEETSSALISAERRRRRHALRAEIESGRETVPRATAHVDDDGKARRRELIRTRPEREYRTAPSWGRTLEEFQAKSKEVLERFLAHQDTD